MTTLQHTEKKVSFNIENSFAPPTHFTSVLIAFKSCDNVLILDYNTENIEDVKDFMLDISRSIRSGLVT